MSHSKPELEPIRCAKCTKLIAEVNFKKGVAKIKCGCGHMNVISGIIKTYKPDAGNFQERRPLVT
jgi:phage FluMu protein Com